MFGFPDFCFLRFWDSFIAGHMAICLFGFCNSWIFAFSGPGTFWPLEFLRLGIFCFLKVYLPFFGLSEFWNGCAGSRRISLLKPFDSRYPCVYKKNQPPILEFGSFGDMTRNMVF